MGQFLADLLAVGIAPEVTLGTFVSPTDWLPTRGCTLAVNPNVHMPEMMRGTRESHLFGIGTIRGIAGDIPMPAFPDAGNRMLAYALGSETSTTSATLTSATTLGANAAIGDTALQVASSASMIANTTVIQIGTTISGIAELRKVTVVTDPTHITVDKALSRAHLSGVAVSNAAAPYTHNLKPLDAFLPSFSAEKQISPTLAEDYSGLIVSKADLKIVTSATPEWTYGLVGQKVVVNSSPPTPSFAQDTPLSPVGVSVFMGGVQDFTPATFDFSLNNNAKPADALNGQTFPQLVYGGNRTMEAKCQVWVQALNGGAGSQGYFADLVGAPLRDVKVIMAQGTLSLTLEWPTAVLLGAVEQYRMGDLVRQELTWGVLGAAGPDDLICTVVNNAYLPYIL